jgi:hypothetical protein
MPRRGKASSNGAITWMWPGHRWPIPGAQRCIVEACDIDRDAGLAAVLITTLPFRGPATTQQETYEHDASRGWIAAGGGSSSPRQMRPGVERTTTAGC